MPEIKAKGFNALVQKNVTRPGGLDPRNQWNRHSGTRPTSICWSRCGDILKCPVRVRKLHTPDPKAASSTDCNDALLRRALREWSDLSWMNGKYREGRKSK